MFKTSLKAALLACLLPISFTANSISQVELNDNLFEACENLDIEQIQKALDAGANVNAQDDDNSYITPIWIAIGTITEYDDNIALGTQRAYEVMKLLVKHGANVNSQIIEDGRSGISFITFLCYLMIELHLDIEEEKKEIDNYDGKLIKELESIINVFHQAISYLIHEAHADIYLEDEEFHLSAVKLVALTPDAWGIKDLLSTDKKIFIISKDAYQSCAKDYYWQSLMNELAKYSNQQ